MHYRRIVTEKDTAPSGSGVRASDAEREAVVARLNTAVGEGRLTMDEFSGRLELAYAARTRGDLDQLLSDLPAETGEVAPAAATSAAMVRAGGQDEGTSWHISPVGGVRHKGRWRVPRHTVLVTILGGLEADLAEAELAAPEVMITKVSVIGGVDIRVPPGVRVEVTHFFALLGGREIDTDVPPAANAPVLRIRAFTLIGGVQVRRSKEPGTSKRRR